MTGFDERILSGIGIFAALVDTGTFAAAGEQLGMSQPGVSRAIARLENRLKIRLFDRTTRVVSLTDDGRRFYEQAMPHVTALEEAATSATRGATNVRGRFPVNLDSISTRVLLGPQLEAFLDDNPELQL